jgi:uncharacterized membrane-anchored protein YjiN (DUF445 family)
MRRALLLAVLAAMVFLVACGESSEEKAKNDACSARAGIQEEVQNLQNLSIETATVDSVKSSLSSIQSDLQKMKDAESDLASDRKAQVEAANSAFASEVSSIVSSLGSNLSISGARKQLESAVTELANSYKQTIASIDC